MAERAVITGATGLLGRQVLQAFDKAGYEAVGTGLSRAAPPKIQKVDIQDSEAVAKLLDEVKPRVVVHCAADRQPDSCTANPTAARKLNVGATSNLASVCAAADILLIYISTDYVFPGVQGDAPYQATSTPNPPNIYGETKLEGEHEVLRRTSPGRGIVLRVPVLYGATEPKENNKESAVNTILDALWKANESLHDQPDKVKMDDWAIRYPTNTEDVARVCVDIARVYLSSTPNPDRDTVQDTTHGQLPRILQFSSEDRMTKYEIMTKLADVMGMSMHNVVADKDGGKPGPDGTLRPYDCHLGTEGLRSLGIDVKTVDFVAWWRRYVGAFRR